MTTTFMILRGMAHVLARLMMSPGRRRHSTERWQDKSRKLRRGRVAEECRRISHLTRGAITHDGLPIGTTVWKYTTARTSRAPVS